MPYKRCPHRPVRKVDANQSALVRDGRRRRSDVDDGFSRSRRVELFRVRIDARAIQRGGRARYRGGAVMGEAVRIPVEIDNAKAKEQVREIES